MSADEGHLGVVLCADDYGYRAGVSRAIERLAAARRISATSALVNLPGWADAAPRIAELAEHVDVGLHVNLVEGAPLGPMAQLARDGRLPPIGDLARMAFTGAIDRGEVRAEVRRQLDVFVAATGRLPDFLDGHQHAHALPGIGAAVLAALAEVAPAQAVPVRDPSDRFARILRRGAARGKALAISAITHGFARLARRRGVPLNDGFAGVYDFSPDADLDALFAAFLAERGPRHLVMCHPGDGAEASDPIAAARQRESEYLASDAFAARLAAAGIELVRFSRLKSPANLSGGSR